MVLNVSSVLSHPYFPALKQICMVSQSDSVLCAVIYRPPKYNKDFVNDFSDLLAEIMPKYDHVLLVGDFNIRVLS